MICVTLIAVFFVWRSQGLLIYVAIYTYWLIDDSKLNTAGIANHAVWLWRACYVDTCIYVATRIDIW